MSKTIATYKRVQEVLLDHGLHAKKHLGQNFIIDRNIIDKIVKVASIDSTSSVLEIGPGIGSLTQALCEHAKEVVAVEIDLTMVNILKDTCIEYDNLVVVHEDFLQYDLNQLPFSSFTVCANLPYYVTTPILFKLFETSHDVQKIVVMVQKEVALRFKAKKDSKQYNALSIYAQTCFDVSVAFDVSKHVFYPKPDVDSSILIFQPKKDVDKEAYAPIFDFIKKCFAFRRKTLANNLKEIVKDTSRINEYLQLADLETSIRAQSLAFEDFKRLFEVIVNNET